MPTPRHTSAEVSDTEERRNRLSDTGEFSGASLFCNRVSSITADAPLFANTGEDSEAKEQRESWIATFSSRLLSLPVEVRQRLRDAYQDIDERRLDDVGKIAALRGVLQATEAYREVRELEKTDDWACAVGAVGNNGFSQRIRRFVASHRGTRTRQPKHPPVRFNSYLSLCDRDSR